MNKIPSSTNRDRNDDLKMMARAIATAMGTEALTEHIADTPDLLVLFCTRALGAEFSIVWIDATDEDCAQVKTWMDYCEELFTEVRYFNGRVVV